MTCYSAYGMLSRVYLSMAGLTTDGLYNGSNVATDFNRGTRNQTYLDLAKRAALKVIAESGAGLIDNYGDLFAAKSFNNNSESLFQLQWLPATQANSSACGNTMVRFLAWSTMVADKDAWGGATYCSWNLWEEFKTYKDETLGKTVDDAVRRHYSVASYGEFYPDMNMKNGGYTYGETENPGNQGANIKKYVIGTTADNGGISEPGNSGTNTYMIRKPFWETVQVPPIQNISTECAPVQKWKAKKALLTKTYATNAVWNLLSKDSIGTISCAVPITASRRLSIT